jgi:hypothetical protein
MNGKGHARRPSAVSQDRYARNWDRVYTKRSGPIDVWGTADDDFDKFCEDSPMTARVRQAKLTDKDNE